MEDELKQWKEKHNKLLTKLTEQRTLTASVKHDLLQTQRALQKEIGEDVKLEEVLSATGKWRGRAQEISLLKCKVRDLRKQLSSSSSSSSHQSTSSTPMRVTATDRIDNRHEQQIGEAKASRRVVQLRKDLEKVQKAYEDLKTKLRAVTGRNKTVCLYAHVWVAYTLRR